MTKTTFKQDLKHIKDKWLLLSISALLAAGLLTFIIVFSRTPFIKDFFIFKDLFNKALVIHVDLSQLFWFLALGLCLSFNYLEKLDFIRKFTFKIALASACKTYHFVYPSSSSQIFSNPEGVPL